MIYNNWLTYIKKEGMNILFASENKEMIENNLDKKINEIISMSTPSNTKRAYTGDMSYMLRWAETAKIKFPFNENAVITFILHHLEEMPLSIDKCLVEYKYKKKLGCHSYATVYRRIVALSIFFTSNKMTDHTKSKKVKSLMKALKKTRLPYNKSKAITKEVLENIIDSMGDALIDVRDKAILLFGFSSGGRRRSEISEAIIENLDENADGNYIYHISRSKTDQTGKGHDVPIKGKAAMALKKWIFESNICSGAIFRSLKKSGLIGDILNPIDINRIVKKRCQKAGYDPKKYSAHGLRRGFMTESGKQGCALTDAMALSGHRSVSTAMGYFETGSVMNNTASELI